MIVFDGSRTMAGRGSAPVPAVRRTAPSNGSPAQGPISVRVSQSVLVGAPRSSLDDEFIMNK